MSFSSKKTIHFRPVLIFITHISEWIFFTHFHLIIKRCSAHKPCLNRTESPLWRNKRNHPNPALTTPKMKRKKPLNLHLNFSRACHLEEIPNKLNWPNIYWRHCVYVCRSGKVESERAEHKKKTSNYPNDHPIPRCATKLSQFSMQDFHFRIRLHQKGLNGNLVDGNGVRFIVRERFYPNIGDCFVSSFSRYWRVLLYGDWLHVESMCILKLGWNWNVFTRCTQ